MVLIPGFNDPILNTLSWDILPKPPIYSTNDEIVYYSSNPSR